MAHIVECSNGHLFDADGYAACPYCNNNVQEIWFGQGKAGSATAPVGAGYGWEGGTVYPENAGNGQGLKTSLGKTEAEKGVPGATVPPRDYRPKRETVAIWKNKRDVLPVAGWLVCIEGENLGKDYRIYAKENTIGRHRDRDICIEGDNAISGKHAVIAYDARNCIFTLIRDENTNTIYLNNKAVYVPAVLAAYDLIEFGKSKFLFVPFCSERFQWQQPKPEGGEG